MSELESIIIKLYKQGYSINSITNYVFSYNKRNCPENMQFHNCYIDKNRKYTRLDCYNYVGRVILNYNNSLRKKFLKNSY